MTHWFDQAGVSSGVSCMACCLCSHIWRADSINQNQAGVSSGVSLWSLGDPPVANVDLPWSESIIETCI